MTGCANQGNEVKKNTDIKEEVVKEENTKDKKNVTKNSKEENKKKEKSEGEIEKAKDIKIADNTYSSEDSYIKLKRITDPVSQNEVIKRAKILMGIEDAEGYTSDVSKETLKDNKGKKIDVYSISWSKDSADEGELSSADITISDDLQVISFNKSYNEDPDGHYENILDTASALKSLPDMVYEINDLETKYLDMNHATTELDGHVLNVTIPIKQNGVTVLDGSYNPLETEVSIDLTSGEVVTYNWSGFLYGTIKKADFDPKEIEEKWIDELAKNEEHTYLLKDFNDNRKDFVNTGKINLEDSFKLNYTFTLPENKINMWDISKKTLASTPSYRDDFVKKASGFSPKNLMTMDSVAEGQSNFKNSSIDNVKLSQEEVESTRDLNIPEETKNKILKDLDSFLSKNKDMETNIVLIKYIDSSGNFRKKYVVTQKHPINVNNLRILDGGKVMMGNETVDKKDYENINLLTDVNIEYDLDNKQILSLNKSGFYGYPLDITLKEFLDKYVEKNKTSEYDVITKLESKDEEAKESIDSFMKTYHNNIAKYNKEVVGADKKKDACIYYMLTPTKDKIEISSENYNLAVNQLNEIVSFIPNGEMSPAKDFIKNSNFEPLADDTRGIMSKYFKEEYLKDAGLYLKQDDELSYVYGNITQNFRVINLDGEGANPYAKDGINLLGLAGSKNKDKLEDIILNQNLPKTLDGKNIKDKMTTEEFKYILKMDTKYANTKKADVEYEKALSEAILEKNKDVKDFINLDTGLEQSIAKSQKSLDDISKIEPLSIGGYFETKFNKEKYKEFYKADNFNKKLYGGEYRGLYLLDKENEDWLKSTDFSIEDVLIKVFE